MQAVKLVFLRDRGARLTNGRMALSWQPARERACEAELSPLRPSVLRQRVLLFRDVLDRGPALHSRSLHAFCCVFRARFRSVGGILFRNLRSMSGSLSVLLGVFANCPSGMTNSMSCFHGCLLHIMSSILSYRSQSANGKNSQPYRRS